MKRSSEQIFDELLILRCQEHDQVAIGLLWKRWQPKVLKWSYGFLNDQDMAHEVAQESWISIFKSINQLTDPALFRFWAYRIVQRKSADWIRKEQRQRQCLKEVKIETMPIEDKSADQIEVMLEAIKELSDHHQRILRLFYLEKSSIKMIAQLLDKPEGTIKSSLFHAREQLKKKLKNISYE